MEAIGNLYKLTTQLNNEVEYKLVLEDISITLNKLLGKKVTLKYLDQINCISCGAKTAKSFGQGFCFQCFSNAPEASECILHPEKCQAHLGISRDQKWAEDHCLQPHFVYMAASSKLKVGITRASQIPTRWIDQGASKAIILAKVPNRHIAGTVEVFLKQYYSDKTNWQQMLKNDIDESIDLINEKSKAISLLPKELQKYEFEDNTVTEITYPNNCFPDKVKSLSFDKESEVSGKLTAVKGQYLIFDNERVINIRKHNGYLIEFKTN